MTPVSSIIAFAAGLLILWLICKLLSFPLKVLWKLNKRDPGRSDSVPVQPGWWIPKSFHSD